MSELILGIDPGEVTGWSLWALEDDRPIQRLEYGLIKDGRAGWLRLGGMWLGQLRPGLVICEKFNEDDGRKGVANLTPIWIEGSIETMCDALGLEVLMQPTAAKSQVHDDVLRRAGLYIENRVAKKDAAIMHQDARDVNDSQIHVLAWAKAAIDHEPTIALYWPDR